MGKGGRGLVIALALTLALGALAIYWLWPTPEPVYEGKPLSKWLVGLASGNANERSQALQVLGEAGTNGVPTLTRMLRAQDSPLKFRLVWLVLKLHLRGWQYTPAIQAQVAARNGFAVLGTNASFAAPELGRILDARLSWGSELCTTLILASFGREAQPAVPALVRLASVTNADLHTCAILALIEIHPRPDVIVPLLVKELSDTNSDCRWQAAIALGAIGADARAAVPALVQALKEFEHNPTGERVPRELIDYDLALRSYGGGSSGMNREYVRVRPRRVAEQALEKIDPEMYRKVVVNGNK